MPKGMSLLGVHHAAGLVLEGMDAGGGKITNQRNVDCMKDSCKGREYESFLRAK